MIRSAVFSRNKIYRYSLERVWDESLPKVMLVGLNPSTADGNVDDPTIRKCMRMASNWGFGSLVVVNLFAFRATDPKDLLAASEPVGKKNTWYIRQYLKEVDEVVCAWGNDGRHLNRAQRVLRWLPSAKCIAINKTGMPAHPLYQKDQSALIDYI